MRTNEALDSLSDMAVFARVVAAGSFSAAARGLGLTPSAVSRQVARLERTLRVRLLERSTRQLRLTEAGRARVTALIPDISAVLLAYTRHLQADELEQLKLLLAKLLRGVEEAQ